MGWEAAATKVAMEVATAAAAVLKIVMARKVKAEAHTAEPGIPVAR